MVPDPGLAFVYRERPVYSGRYDLARLNTDYFSTTPGPIFITGDEAGKQDISGCR